MVKSSREPLPPKRERTRRQLIDAAIRVFAEKGVANTSIQEIAVAAGVANGTFYNHFPTKEAVMEAVAIAAAQGLSERIDASYGHITDAAERMAIGNRRYVGLAIEHPEWARMMMDVVVISPELIEVTASYAGEDLLLGIRQGRFRVPNQLAGMNAIIGTCSGAMRAAIIGPVPKNHAQATATVVLRALGMDFDEAAEIARRPLPPMPGGLLPQN